MLGKTKLAALGVLIVFVAALAVTAIHVSASSAGAPAGEPVLVYVPANAVTGPISDTTLAFIGQQYTGDFCSGARPGELQGIYVVYPTATDPAVITLAITANGELPGTLVSSLTDNGLVCTDGTAGVDGVWGTADDTGLGPIHEYSGIAY